MLPDTFADIHQTLFSTSFFNFQSSPTSTVVSKWVWLYFVVTAGLTSAFVAAWYSFNRAITRSGPSSSLRSTRDGVSASFHLSPTADRYQTVQHPQNMNLEPPELPEKQALNDSDTLSIHNISDAMAPEKFGRTCAICGEAVH